MTVATTDRAILRRWRSSSMSVMEDLLTLEDGRSYGKSLDSWQREDLRAIFEQPARHVWLERPRGHSKTQDLAAVALDHVLRTRNARAYVCAVDREQADLIRDSLTAFIRRSGILRDTFTVTQSTVSSPGIGARLTVMAADAASSWGLRPSLVIADELAAWNTLKHEQLFLSLFSALGKVAGARLLVATTAGAGRDGLAWRLREQVQEDPAWYFSCRGQCASWISKEFLDQQRRILTPAQFAALHLNQWQDASEAFVSVEAWDACRERLPPLRGRTPLVVGVDGAVSGDCFAIVAVSRHPERPDDVAVRACRIWKASGSALDYYAQDGPLTWLADFCKNHNVLQITYDPYQLHQPMTDFSRENLVWTQPFPQGADRLRADVGLLHLIEQRRLTHQDEPELREHVGNARLQMSVREDSRARLVKGTPSKKIDAAVALSMAADRALYLRMSEWDF